MLTRGGLEHAAEDARGAAPHVVFVLATTDPAEGPAHHPLAAPSTSSSRCSRRSSSPAPARRPRSGEARGFDPEASTCVARAGAGSARDALSLLDQALALGAGRLDAEQVARPSGDAVRASARGPAMPRRPRTWPAPSSVCRGPRRGPSTRATWPTTCSAPLRDAFLLAAHGGRVPRRDAGGRCSAGSTLAGELGNTALVRVLETLGQAIVDMRGTGRRRSAPRARGRAGAARPPRFARPLETLIERVERLERPLRRARPPAPAPPAGEPPAPPVVPRPGRARGRRSGRRRPEIRRSAPDLRPSRRRPAPAPTEPAAARRPRWTRPATPTGPLDLDEVIVAWASVLAKLPPPLARCPGGAADRGGAGRGRRFGCPARAARAHPSPSSGARPTSIKGTLAAPGTQPALQARRARRFSERRARSAADRRRRPAEPASRPTTGATSRTRSSTPTTGGRHRRRPAGHDSRESFGRRPSSRNATTTDDHATSPAPSDETQAERGEPEAAQPETAPGAADAGRHGRGAGRAGERDRRGIGRAAAW